MGLGTQTKGTTMSKYEKITEDGHGMYRNYSDANATVNCGVCGVRDDCQYEPEEDRWRCIDVCDEGTQWWFKCIRCGHGVHRDDCYLYDGEALCASCSEHSKLFCTKCDNWVYSCECWVEKKCDYCEEKTDHFYKWSNEKNKKVAVCGACDERRQERR